MAVVWRSFGGFDLVPESDDLMGREMTRSGCWRLVDHESFEHYVGLSSCWRRP